MLRLYSVLTIKLAHNNLPIKSKCMQLTKALFFSFLLLGISASAQQIKRPSSYIVTKTNDTIYGKIKTNLLIGDSKLVTKDGSYQLDANLYTAYYNAKQKATYHSKLLPMLMPEKLAKKLDLYGKSDWLKCLEDGDVKIYEIKSNLYGYELDNLLNLTATMGLIVASGGIQNSEFSNWYIEKEGHPLVSIKYSSLSSTNYKTRKERKALLKELLADKLSEDKFKNKSFTFKMFETLLEITIM